MQNFDARDYLSPEGQERLDHFLAKELGKVPQPSEIRFGFTKDRKNYTHSTAVLDDRGKPVWAVVPIPGWWAQFGRPARKYGQDGMMGNSFYPLRVLHNLKV